MEDGREGRKGKEKERDDNPNCIMWGFSDMMREDLSLSLSLSFRVTLGNGNEHSNGSVFVVLAVQQTARLINSRSYGEFGFFVVVFFFFFLLAFFPFLRTRGREGGGRKETSHPNFQS